MNVIFTGGLTSAVAIDPLATIQAAAASHRPRFILRALIASPFVIAAMFAAGDECRRRRA